MRDSTEIGFKREMERERGKEREYGLRYSTTIGFERDRDRVSDTVQKLGFDREREK